MNPRSEDRHPEHVHADTHVDAIESPRLADLLLVSSGERPFDPESDVIDALDTDEDVRAAASMLTLVALVGVDGDAAEDVDARSGTSHRRGRPLWLAAAASFVALIGGAWVWQTVLRPAPTDPASSIVRIALPPAPTTPALSDTSHSLLITATTHAPPISPEPRISNRLASVTSSWLDPRAIDLDTTTTMTTFSRSNRP